MPNQLTVGQTVWASVRGSKNLEGIGPLMQSALVVPPTRRMTIGNRAFPVAEARVWNVLPSFVTD